MERRSVQAAIAALPQRGRIFLASACGLPTMLADALGEEQDRFDGLTVYSGLLFEPVRLLDAVPNHLRLVSLHPTAPVEPLITRGDADYLPLRYSRIPDAFVPGGPLAVDAALIQVSPPDARGYCSFGPAVSTAAPVARAAPLVVAEINPRCPRAHGEAFIHISEIDIAVEVDHPLVELKPARVGEAERTIAQHVAGLIPDQATIQIGIGAVPQAILEALSNHQDLGVHSGMLCDGMIPLVERGIITGAHKALDPFKLAAGEALGTETLFRFIDDNPLVRMLPASLSHGLNYVSRHRRFVAINSALEVDLTGQVNAEWLNGRQLSGLGGSFDFVEAAMYAADGIGIVALPATAVGGKASRITARMAAGVAITAPRFCVDYVVTEYGVADLRARTLRERAASLIAVAHPDFRAALTDSLAQSGVA